MQTTLKQRKQGRPPREDAVRQIVLASRSLFASRSYKNVSVEDIIRTSGVSRPTVYRHFANKEAIAVQIFTEFVAQSQAAVYKALEGSESVIAMAERSIAAYLDHMYQQGDLLSELVDIQNLNLDSKELYTETMQSYTSTINAALRRLGKSDVPEEFLETFLIGIDRMAAAICLKKLEANETLDVTSYVSQAKLFLISFLGDALR